jgi:integrase
MKKSITKRAVDALKPGQYITDDELLGFVVRRLPSGRLSYGYRYAKDGKRRWIRLGVGIVPDAARKAALKHAGNVAGDGDPLPEREARRLEAMTARTVGLVLDDWLAGHAKMKALRSYDEMESLLRRYVRPTLGATRINDLKRSEIANLLSDIAAHPSTRSRDGLSRRVADKTLGVLRSAFNWHAIRDDEFVSPIVARMARTSLKELSRDRTLDDAEIRTLWRALDHCTPPAYVRLVRILLLSGARLNEMGRLQWPEIVGDVAIVPSSRTKTKLDHVVPITEAMAVLIGKPADAGDFVFSTDHGATPFSGFSKAKARLDREIAKLRAEAKLPPMPGWRLHDLRRTARSLLSRAKVDPDIAERVLGHAMPGIRGVYDRHPFLTEKRDALERLAAVVREIVEPPTGKVVKLRRRGAAA